MTAVTASMGGTARFFNDGGIQVQELEIRDLQSLIRWQNPESREWTRGVWVKTSTMIELGCEVAIAESYARKYGDGVPIKPFEYEPL